MYMYIQKSYVNIYVNVYEQNIECGHVLFITYGYVQSLWHKTQQGDMNNNNKLWYTGKTGYKCTFFTGTFSVH